MATNSNKPKRQTLTTPVGVASFPNISTKDSGRQYSDDKFKTKLILDRKEAAGMIAKLEAFGKAELAGEDPDEIDMPFMPHAEDETKIVLVAKSKHRPAVFDSRNRPVVVVEVDKKTDEEKVLVKIGSGSKLRLSVGLGTYPATLTKDKKTGKDKKTRNAGVNLYLNQVQLIDLREYGAGTSNFGEVDDGYEHDGASNFSGGDDDGDEDVGGNEPDALEL